MITLSGGAHNRLQVLAAISEESPGAKGFDLLDGSWTHSQPTKQSTIWPFLTFCVGHMQARPSLSSLRLCAFLSSAGIK
jgi:hypothetical protein